MDVMADLDLLFKALADPARRSLVEMLDRGPLSVTVLTQSLRMSMPAVLQHLKVLEAAGLVLSEKTGRVRTFRCSPRALDEGELWFAERRRAWERRFDGS